MKQSEHTVRKKTTIKRAKGLEILVRQRLSVSLARYRLVKINDFIGEFEESSIMRADDAYFFGGILADELLNNVGIAIIQPRGGLIEEKDGGIFHEGACKGCALSLTARKLACSLFAEGIQSKGVHKLLSSRFPLFFGDHRHFCTEAEVSFDTEERQKIDALKHVTGFFSAVAAAGDA